MSFIPIKYPVNRKPSYSGNSLKSIISHNAKKIGLPPPSIVIPFNEGSGLYAIDVQNNNTNSIIGNFNCAWVLTEYGYSLQWLSTESGLRYTTGFEKMESVSYSTWSMFCIATITLGDYTYLLSIQNSNEEYPSYLYAGGVNLQATLIVKEALAQTASITPSGSTAQITVAGVNYDNTSRKVWLYSKDGNATATNTAAGNNYYFPNQFNVGQVSMSGITFGQSPIMHLVYFWQDYGLTDNNVAFLASNPYALLQPPSLNMYSTAQAYFNLAALYASKPTRIFQ